MLGRDWLPVIYQLLPRVYKWLTPPTSFWPYCDHNVHDYAYGVLTVVNFVSTVKLCHRRIGIRKNDLLSEIGALIYSE